MAEERVVLLVDDMEQMVAIAPDFLQRRLEGVRVVAFTRPKEALAWLMAAPRVDLVLSDNHMAEMDGLAFLEATRAVAPHAARALMTAYLDIAATPPQLGARGIHALLRKPWEWNDFGRAIFEILAMSPQERAQAEREGPTGYPEGAFAEFAAVRRRPSSPAAHAPAVSTVTPVPSATPPARALPAPERARPTCPHCHRDMEAPFARRSGSTDEEEALRLLAYLQAHPGVAQRLRAMASGAQARRA